MRLVKGADLFIQGGQAIAPGNWVQINSTTGYFPDYPGFDKFNYAPAIGRSISWAPYRTLSTEPDHTLSGYSFSENNWIVLYSGHQFHDEHSCPGHNEGGWSVDPTTSVMYGPSCYSAGQAFDDVKTPVWRWDLIAQTGTAMLTNPGPIESINQMNTYFDPRNHKLAWFGGGGSNSLTFEYTPDTNLYAIAPTTFGSAPGINLRQPATFYRPVDGKGYYLFGKSGSTVSNSINSYDLSTRTWALFTPSGTPPSTRMDTGCAYSTADDAALCTGGYDDEDPPGPTNKSDTWILDFAGRVTGCGSPPCWVQAAPATPLVSFPGVTVFQRIVYDEPNNIFLVGNVNTTGNRFIWGYRFNGGRNAGYAAVTPSVAYPPAPGTLNRDVSGGSPSLSQAISLAATPSTVYFARAEGAGPAATGNAFYRHIYVSKIVSGTVTDLPNPSAYDSVAPDIAGTTVEANEPTIMVSSNTPWVSWSQWNGSGAVNTDIVAKSFNGTAWVGGNVGRGAECTATSAFCLQHSPKIIDANGSPTIAYVQATHTTVPYQDLVLVKQFNGSIWNLLGSYLNVAYTATNIKTIADHPSIASDGTANPWVSWTEYTMGTSSPPDQETYTNAKMYLKHWNGASWDLACAGTGNVNASTGWASNTSVTVLGGIPYVAFTERGSINGGTANDISKLYVRKCQSGAWSTVGSVYLNRDQVMGWVFRPEITNDGTNLWVAWDEQGNVAPWAQTYTLLPTGFGRIAQRVRTYVSQWNGSTWTKMGGTPTMDPTYGAVSRVAIAIQSGAAAVAWGETEPGGLRQIYAKQWNGTDWSSVVAVIPNPVGGPAVFTGVTVR
jgi:hypothetical protein